MMLERPSIEAELAWEQARRLTMPLLILRGALSEVIAHETAERLTRLLPNARCVEVAGVTHSPTLYEEEAQLALREFFGISAAPDLSYAAQSIGRR
jgi:pimeloyl-ACP methyl ester carboxylesterase